MPVSRGGSNDYTNWRIAHKKCNSQKGSLTYEEYRQWLTLEAKRNGHIK
jgi:5-methylcytosine-specific restriction endonuclease McrA